VLAASDLRTLAHSNRRQRSDWTKKDTSAKIDLNVPSGLPRPEAMAEEVSALKIIVFSSTIEPRIFAFLLG
jgi:hypothetical protein